MKDSAMQITALHVVDGQFVFVFVFVFSRYQISVFVFT
jgi:hypothetical protein